LIFFRHFVELPAKKSTTFETLRLQGTITQLCKGDYILTGSSRVSTWTYDKRIKHCKKEHSDAVKRV